MLPKTLKVLIGGLKRAITEPFQELNRWQLAARYAYDLGRYGARQLKHDRAPQMASALAFRTLFGLAPILVVTTILIKTINGPEAIIGTLHEILVAAGLDQLQVGMATEAGAAADTSSVTLAEWLENLTAQLINTDMSAAGLVGLAVIIYAAIGLMVTIENSFNIIYRAPDGRPWSRRFPLYWFILTTSPIVIGLTSYVNQLFTNWIDTVEAWHGVLLVARYVWGFSIPCLFIVAVYTLIPNSKVSIKAAFGGAFVATMLLWFGKNTLGAYLGNVFAINQLYGSLGLVPLFMFWVYLMWLAVLFGLEVAATIQMLGGRSLEELNAPRSRSVIPNPTSVLTVAEVISERFVAGRTITSQEVSEITSLPTNTVLLIVDRLVQDGWLHRLERPDGALSLARPPETMKANEILKLGYNMADSGEQGRTSALVSQLREAQLRASNGITMSMLVPAAPTAPSR